MQISRRCETQLIGVFCRDLTGEAPVALCQKMADSEINSSIRKQHSEQRAKAQGFGLVAAPPIEVISFFMPFPPASSLSTAAPRVRSNASPKQHASVSAERASIPPAEVGLALLRAVSLARCVLSNMVLGAVTTIGTAWKRAQAHAVLACAQQLSTDLGRHGQAA